jgi:hypothetical protein
MWFSDTQRSPPGAQASGGSILIRWPRDDRSDLDRSHPTAQPHVMGYPAHWPAGWWVVPLFWGMALLLAFALH